MRTPMQCASIAVMFGAAVVLTGPARATCVAAPPNVSCEQGVRVVRGTGVQPFRVDVTSAGASSVALGDARPLAGAMSFERGTSGGFGCLGRDCGFLARRLAAPQTVVVLEPGVRVILPTRAPKRFRPPAFVRDGALVVAKHRHFFVPQQKPFLAFGRGDRRFVLGPHKGLLRPLHRGSPFGLHARGFAGRGLVRPGGLRR